MAAHYQLVFNSDMPVGSMAFKEPNEFHSLEIVCRTCPEIRTITVSEAGQVPLENGLQGIKIVECTKRACKRSKRQGREESFVQILGSQCRIIYLQNSEVGIPNAPIFLLSGWDLNKYKRVGTWGIIGTDVTFTPGEERVATINKQDMRFSLTPEVIPLH